MSAAPPDAAPGGARSLAAVHALVVLVWAYSVLPSLLQVTLGTRPQIDVSVEVAQVPASVYANRLLALALLAVSAAIVVRHIDSRANKDLVVVLAPWALMIALTYRTDRPLSWTMLMYPAIMLAFCLARPPLRVLLTLGWLTSLTALLALAMGQWTRFGLVRSAAFADKALVGDGSLLAGPFAHPNALGLALVLGLPALLLARRSWARDGAIAAVLLAVLWGGARTSLAAALLVLTVAVVLRRPVGVRLHLVRVALLAGALAVICVPLLADTGNAYNYRGRMWLASWERWKAMPWLGAGPDYYRTISQSVNELGRQAFHGHNALVHTITTGGLVATVLVAALLVNAARHALRWARDGHRMPVLFLLTFVYVSVLEVVTDFRVPSSFGVVAWVSLAAVFFASNDHQDAGAGMDGRRDRDERRSPTGAAPPMVSSAPVA